MAVALPASIQKGLLLPAARVDDGLLCPMERPMHEHGHDDVVVDVVGTVLRRRWNGHCGES